MTDVQAAIASVKGFKVSGVHAGLKADGALDMALIYSETPCMAAGVFTTNLMKAAPVLVDQETLAKNSTHIRAVIVNTKCANACTGQQGIDNARQMQRWTAERLGISEDEVLVMSTGVIGTQLPMEKIQRGIGLAVDALGAENWEAAARGIMTTDTRPKLASYRAPQGYSIAGIAKGAGMIAPNMATMLGLIVTDATANYPEPAAHIRNPDLGDMLHSGAEYSFNRIAVDGDTSTNDTVLMLANGASGISARYNELSDQLDPVCAHLAKAVVRDGEGATKFITIHISHAFDYDDARSIANTIATSPLVKTAFYGGDANWGRIVAAAGRSSAKLDPNKLKLWISRGEQLARELLLFENGMPTAYDENEASAIMREPSIVVELDCGSGEPNGYTVWTCDLSHDYVSINGHYRS